jgi:membrane-bound lytic murein transglycosylase MltF
MRRTNSTTGAGERTYSSLNDMTPAEFIRSLRKDEDLWFSTALNLGQGHIDNKRLGRALEMIKTPYVGAL